MLISMKISKKEIEQKWWCLIDILLIPYKIIG